MPKKYSTTTSLVIVESPAKCKKIEEYLGPGYKCLASYGHLRELSSLKNINIENNYTPTYSIIDNSIKKKQIEVLRKSIKEANEVILATDDDREGEAIAWHICELFNLDIKKTKRIIFHEITEKAIQNSIKNPLLVNMNVVNAQQARQILDVLVGFKISPILWKCISKNTENSLSAGRCQTPALQIIYDNYKNINENEGKKIYNTTGYFTNSNIAFELNKQYESEDEITAFLNRVSDFSHIYNCSPISIKTKPPPEPFTTSRLQQVSSNELHYSPKETMKICQSLYEAGYITYMRTDSKTYSEDFINSIKKYIIEKYTPGEKYINEKIELLISGEENKDKNDNNKKSKCVQPQSAHEAIRPTNILLNCLSEKFNSKEKRMYKLIWENTLESCMSSATYFSITATINSYENTKFTFISELIDFPGWKIISKKYSTENKDFQYLQKIKQNSIIPYKKICSRVSIKGLKQHYTEARLVQLLEEMGIGRPSTFSSIVDKIQERGYVKKEDIKGKEIECKDFELENGDIFEIETKREFGNEKTKLVIQQLGIFVIEFLDKNFNELFNYHYTKNMEEYLDKISQGILGWTEICKSCNEQIDNLIDNLDITSKIEIKLDENNSYIIGKYGPVIKCIEEDSNGKEEIKFKSVKKNFDVKMLENGNYNLNDVVDNNKTSNSQFILGKWNNHDVVLKKGKFGLYISWGENSKTLKELGNRPIENITFDEIKKYLEEGSNLIREINKDLSIRRGPKGDYLFFKNSRMKKPQFHDIKCFLSETKEDYKICDINILKSWINEKYNI